MKQKTAMLLLTLLTASALGKVLGVGVRYDPSGGPITVDGLPLATTWEQVLARVGPPAPPTSGDVFTHWPETGLSVRFEDGRARSLTGTSLEQGGHLLLQDGDTATQVRAVLGDPVRQNDDDWEYAQPACSVHLSDGHLATVTLRAE